MLEWTIEIEDANHTYTTALTKDVYEAVSGIKNNNSTICFRALLFGLEVKLWEDTFRMFPRTDGGFELAHVLNGNSVVGCDISLGHFTKICENAHPDQIADVVFALQKYECGITTKNNSSVNAPKRIFHKC